MFEFFTQAVWSPYIAGAGIGPGTTTETGGTAIRLFYAAFCSVSGLDLYENRSTCIQTGNSFGIRIEGNTCRDASLFYDFVGADSGQGYGIVTGECAHTTIANNVVFRTRHGIDVSYWSSDVTVTGNVVHGSTAGSMQVHPNCRMVTVTGNSFSGGVGNNGTDGPPEVNGTEWGTSVTGGGIGIREYNDHITIAQNVVRGAYTSGLRMNGDGCSNILIEGNSFLEGNMPDGDTHGGITATPASDVSPKCPNLVIRGNLIDTAGEFGIAVGYDDAVVEGNVIRNANGTGLYAGVRSDQTARPLYRPIIRNNDIRNVNIPVTFDHTTDRVLATDHELRDGQKLYFLTTGTVPADLDTVTLYYVVEAAAGEFKVSETAYGSPISFTDNGSGTTYAAGPILLGLYVGGEDLGAGTNDQSVYDPIIEGNVVTGCRNDGIRIATDPSATTGPVYNPIVRNNYCAKNDANGIAIRAFAYDAIVTGNHCENNGLTTLAAGINLRGENARAFANRCIDTQGTSTQNYGIFINATATGTILGDNWLEGNASNLTNNGTGTIVAQQAGASEVVFNETGANYDFRVEGDGDANCLVVDE